MNNYEMYVTDITARKNARVRGFTVSETAETAQKAVNKVRERYPQGKYMIRNVRVVIPCDDWR